MTTSRLVPVYDHARRTLHQVPSSTRCLALPSDYDVCLKQALVQAGPGGMVNLSYGVPGVRMQMVLLEPEELDQVESGALRLVELDLPLWVLCDIDPPSTGLPKPAKLTITVRRADLQRLGACADGPSSGMALYERESGGADEITREWGPEEDAEFRRKHPDFWVWMVGRGLLPIVGEVFGANTEQMRELIAWLPTVLWLRPAAEVDLGRVRERVNAHLSALRAHRPDAALPADVELEVITGPLSDASVRDSVWDSVWASVRASVRDSVWASVWASVRDSVWASVWDSVWASVWDSVWASVRDSVWASVWELDYLASGMSLPSPWRPLLDIWAMGAWPICLRQDGRFVVYVPPVAP